MDAVFPKRLLHPIALVSILALYSTLALPVHARTNPRPSPADSCSSGHFGGACFSTNPGNVTPEERRMQSLKRELAAKIAAGELPNDPNHTRFLLGLKPLTVYHLSAKDAGAAAYQPAAMGFSGPWYWVSMNKWVEADGGIAGSCYGTSNGYTNPRQSQPAAYYYNMCGPGSSQAAISHWNSNPSTYSSYYYYGYVASQGLHWLGYMFYLASREQGSCSNYSTCTGTEKDVINSEINSSWYSVDYCAGANATCSTNALTEWRNDVNTDIVNAGVPLVDEVMTCDPSGGACQAGWPYRADHFQTIDQYNPSEGHIRYGETGNAADTCYFGYAAGAPGAFTGSWFDPVANTTFSDSSGWNYASVSYQWSRSLDLIW